MSGLAAVAESVFVAEERTTHESEGKRELVTEIKENKTKKP